MKWIALPLMLLMAFATPATFAASCAIPSNSSELKMEMTCACCDGGGACCLESSSSNQVPLKTSAVPVELLQPLTTPDFQLIGFADESLRQVIYRISSPAQHVRPPPDATILCRFLI